MRQVNAPLRLLAIDPALAHTGILVAEVTGYGQVKPLESCTVTTDPKDHLLARLRAIADGIGTMLGRAWHDAYRGSEPVVYAVVEDPEGKSRRAPGVHRKARDIHYTGAAFGVALARLLSDETPPPITLAPVQQWYPKQQGFAQMSKKIVVERAKHEIDGQLGRISEHVAMAYALADWWSRTAAVRIWHLAVAR